MSIPNAVQQHPASVDAYIRHGWSLVPIPAGTKGPRTAGWNIKGNALKSQNDLPQGYGIGLAHAYSGTMALDIDEWASATALLAAHGVDLNALYTANDAVIVDSGKQGRGKLLYAMPFGLTLPSKKIIHNNLTAYELRCATANGLTVQDVLPPSIHPDTHQPYRWAGNGHWTRLPAIPQALLDLWQSLLSVDKERSLITGDGINASWDDVRRAVENIPADCSRDEWINVGMALHWAGTRINQVAQAIHLWNEWSRQSETKYPGEREIETQWHSFRLDKHSEVTLGTLFHIAKKYGWKRPLPDASEYFKATDTPDKPTDRIKSLTPQIPKMDFSLWPEVLRTRAMQISESVGCDPLVPLFAGLAAMCGAVDAQTRLELMEGYKVPPILWLMTIGAPADKKTPGSTPMMSVLTEIESEDRPRFKKEMLEWEGKEAMYAASKKAFLDFSASPEAMLSNDAAPIVHDLPPQPVPLRIKVSDITSQKMVRHAAERPRGLLCYLDEMNGWVGKLTDRSSGDDRSAWVVSYEGNRYEMDRVGAGSIVADNMAVSIYGNIQPQVLQNNLESLTSDGLLQRFIFAILDSGEDRLSNPIPSMLTNEQAWHQLVRLCYALPAMTYKLSDEAYNMFREFQAWYIEAKRDERLLNAPAAYMTAFGKLEGTAGRLILIFHIAENPFSSIIDADVVRRVWKVIRGYIIPSYRYVLCDMTGESFDRWLQNHILHYSDSTHISLAEIKRSTRRQIGHLNTWQQDQAIISSMQGLEQARWVHRVDDGSREKNHVAQWVINPDLLKQFKKDRDDVIRARQRRNNEIYQLSTIGIPTVHGYVEGM